MSCILYFNQVNCANPSNFVSSHLKTWMNFKLCQQKIPNTHLFVDPENDGLHGSFWVCKSNFHWKENHDEDNNEYSHTWHNQEVHQKTESLQCHRVKLRQTVNKMEEQNKKQQQEETLIDHCQKGPKIMKIIKQFKYWNIERGFAWPHDTSHVTEN